MALRLNGRAVNPRSWAWFDVHRATFWQLVAASLLVAGVTFAVCVIVSVG